MSRRRATYIPTPGARVAEYVNRTTVLAGLTGLGAGLSVAAVAMVLGMVDQVRAVVGL